MSNITFEDYKNAIKAKYEKEKEEGDYSNNLSSPTPANLRKLCVKRFKSNPDKEDLNAFESFFDFPFDKDKKNLFGDDEMNKLESVRRFLLGKTERPAEDTVQLAAILVDLQPRPFNKYRKQIDEEDLELFNELRGGNNFGKEVSSDNVNDQVEIENANDLKTDFVVEESLPVQSEEVKYEETPISTFFKMDEKPKSNKFKYLAIVVVLAGLGLILYLILPNKECMQWSGDHYEVVDCSLKSEGFISGNPVELLDENLLGLKKIKVCDTTVYFDKNHNAIIWYAKRGDSVDFFNNHGRHPENNSPLKPVTKYILDKYVNKK
ncbi:hypothetical protein EYY60_13595 [Flavobacterium zhairuonense]|uniref:hypothetical protein n=1 Tax=Flavobacterium zhairuonense TaxID=2493631 RepID=UPI001049BA1C|nr:hypothetical protein [Flavobacterium zhairuonense]KAF2509407.1 hypothetical protein EYY60_13595 [Flavobacterium zhairuonense]